jgi:hypothetical protein
MHPDEAALLARATARPEEVVQQRHHALVAAAVAEHEDQCAARQVLAVRLTALTTQRHVEALVGAQPERAAVELDEGAVIAHQLRRR